MSKPSNAIPAEWAEHMFARFTALYGSQKVGAMWAEADIGRVKATWRQALGRFQVDTIGAALRSLEEGGGGWPPALPEFVELCRQASIAREQHRPVAPALADNRTPDPARARAAISHIEDSFAGARLDPLLWARSPKSAGAVRQLVTGARADRHLSEILAAHRANGGADCRSAEAVAAIRALGPLQTGQGVQDQAAVAMPVLHEEATA